MELRISVSNENRTSYVARAGHENRVGKINDGNRRKILMSGEGGATRVILNEAPCG
jgi:hypothetical protein